jgi:uncharacterized glyoxalase superfamily protein PhnB
MPTPKLLSVAPVLLTRDLAAATAFWRDHLGFECVLYHEPPRFAICARDGVRVMLALAHPGAAFRPNWQIVSQTNQAYFWVDDAKALYEEAIRRGAKIDFTLYDTPWGTREFGVQDPDDHDIAFGQVL